MNLRRSLSTLLLSLSLGLPVHAASALGRFVVVGDSLTAGFQNFSLFTSPINVPPGGQEYGYAQVVAKQAGTDLRNPVISYPGIPPALTTDSAGHIIHEAGLGLRLNPFNQTHNVSVPSYTVADALEKTIVYSQVLANPTYALALAVYGVSLCGVRDFSLSSVTISSVDCAVQLKPDTILVSIGSNDALQSLTFGIPPTSHRDFLRAYHKLVTALNQTDAQIMLANVPDVTATPYLWTRATFRGHCGRVPATAGNYFVVNLVDPTHASADICTNYVPLPDSLVVAAQLAVDDYNTTIASEAAKIGAVVLDINGLFKDVAAHNVTVEGRQLTTAFGGGLFSLDGLHPTNTGYAIMANEAIKTMNRAWHTGIPPVSVEQTAKNDPLLPPKK